MENPNAWHVYQLHGDAGLLYVGYSRWLKQRLAAHRRSKPWWPEVTSVQSEEFGTEDAARQREKELWAGGQPKYNQRSPFVTEEEHARRQRDYQRGLDRQRDPDRHRKPPRRSAESLARRREYDRKRDRERNQTPEGRNRASKTSYAKRARRGTGTPRKRWRQTGPGLF